MSTACAPRCARRRSRRSRRRVTSRLLPSGSFSVAVTWSASCVRSTSSVFHCTRDAELVELLAHDALVVVLAEHEDVGVGRDRPCRRRRAGRGPCAGPAPRGCAGAALAELQRALDDAELRVDLQRAGLDAERAGLRGRSGVAVDDLDAHAAAHELVGEHEAGRAGADDQDVRIHIAPPQQEARGTIPCLSVRNEPFRWPDSHGAERMSR